MTSISRTRRRLLSLLAPGAVGLAFTLVVPSLAAKEIACADPEADSDEGLRKSMNYRVIGKDVEKTCLKCTFYTAEDVAGCGRCQIFSGVVNGDGSCDAWSS